MTKNPFPPRAPPLHTGVLSLVVRLVSAQCAVFTLWYSRRAYERSRGEMITMLYEKTLDRKILGAKQEKEGGEDIHTTNDEETDGLIDREENGDANGPSDSAKASRSQHQSLLLSVWTSISSLFLRKGRIESKKEKEAASMGKILNLMRQVLSEDKEPY